MRILENGLQMIKHILFDLDGVLTDSAPAIFDAINHTLIVMGKEPLPEKQLRQYLGPPLKLYMTELLGENEAETGIAHYRARYREQAASKTIPYPGIVALLARLKQEKFQMFVATSKGQDMATMVLQHHGLADFFHGIYGGDHRGAAKEVVIRHVLDDHNLSPDQCVMVGDRHHDIDGAKTCGLRSIGVLWGYGLREELENAGADAIAATPDDMPTLLHQQITGR